MGAPADRVKMGKSQPYSLLDDVKVIRWFSEGAKDRIIPDAWARVFFADYYGKASPPPLAPFEQAARTIGNAWKLAGTPEQAFGRAIPQLAGVFLADESINSGKLWSDARQLLQRDLEQMDDTERKQTIAALMAYIGELQVNGALESVPSGRLARVAKLIGEAAEIVSADPATYIPLFRDREIDAKTGKKPTALEWFNQVWKPRVEEGEATGDDIRQTDFKFYEALASYQKSKGNKLSDLLPPSPTRSRLPDTERLERRRKATRDSKRRTRAKPEATPR